MAVDSVNGSSSDATEAARIRRLQDERTSALKRAEERSQKEITRMNDSRQEQLEAINEDHTKEIEERRNEARGKLDVAKADADSRLRAFEAESQKLSEQASRQLQSKAHQLQRTSVEMEKQREILHKHQDDTIQKLSEANARREEDAIRQGLHESAAAHMNQARALNEINERGDAEQLRLHDEFAEAKRLAVSEGSRDLRKVQEDYQDSTNQIERAVAFGRREGQEQMSKDRANVEREQTRLSIEAGDRSEKLERESQHSLERLHYQGNRKIAEAQDTFGHQIDDAERSAKKKVLERANKTEYTMRAMQAEAEAQEQLARIGYANQKGAIGAARNKAIEDSIKANEKLQAQLRADYDTRSRASTEETEKKLEQLFASDAAELKLHRAEGRQAVNMQLDHDSVNVSSRGAKAADPFYRVQKLGVQVEDGEHECIVSLAVPEHEQESVRISMQRNSLTISGTRRFQEHLKTDDGHESSTNSYQSYAENFPVHGKLEMNNMSRVYDGGVLMFRIPKG